MVVDVVAHGLGLAGDHVGERARLAPGLGQHHRQRRLQRMGEVADVGALALDDLLVVRHQRVEFVGQGLQLDRIAAHQPLGPALAHVGHLAAQGEQRLQAHPDLEQHGGDQAAAEQDQGDGRRGGEAPGVGVDRTAVLGGDEDHRRRTPRQAAEHGHRPQTLIERAHGVVIDRLARLGGQGGGPARRPFQLAVEQRPRRDQRGQAAVLAGFGNLPVLAGIGAQGAGVGQGRGQHLAVVADGRAGVEAVGDVGQALVEPAERRLLEKGGQDAAGDEQGGENPGGGQDDQPPDQRRAPPDAGGVAQRHDAAASPSSGTRR